MVSFVALMCSLFFNMSIVLFDPFLFPQGSPPLWAACGLWAVGCGLRAGVCGLWSVLDVDCGLCAVVCGLWSVLDVDCGLWSVGCGLWSVVCG